MLPGKVYPATYSCSRLSCESILSPLKKYVMCIMLEAWHVLQIYGFCMFLFGGSMSEYDFGVVYNGISGFYRLFFGGSLSKDDFRDMSNMRF